MTQAPRMSQATLTLSALMASGAAWAQSPAEPSAPAAAEPSAPATAPSAPAANRAADAAAKHYENGAKAAGKNRWEEARSEFLQAWGLKRHYQIAANLGRAELMTGRYRDAAEHLAFFLREANETSEEDKRLARDMLAKARAKVGTVALRVEPGGAEVWVDGAPAGDVPAGGEVFVEAGRRVVIEARRAGYEPARGEVEVAAGTTKALTLKLSPEGAAAGAQVKPPAGGLTGAGAMQGVGEAQSDEAQGARGSGERNPLWIGVGLGASVAAATAGVMMMVMAVEKSDEMHAIEEAGYPADRKGDWGHLYETRGELLNTGTWSFIAAGALGAATVIYAMTGSKPEATPRTGRVVVYPMGSGLGLSGSF